MDGGAAAAGSPPAYKRWLTEASAITVARVSETVRTSARITLDGPPSGVLVIDKPTGLTSHDVVARVRRALRTREVGHAGTLDPMATGVLVVAVGEATKLVRWLTAHDKSYEATVALGVETDTLDADGCARLGAPVDQALRTALSRWSLGPDERAAFSLLSRALDAERARTTQVPPAYSAIKTDGERSFVRARRGETAPLPPREVDVRRIDVVACSDAPPSVRFVLDVGKGYYVRSFARDFAAALGTFGHLTHLRRTRSGPFAINEAAGLATAPDLLRERIHRLPFAAARALPVAHLTPRGVADARHGRAVKAADICPLLPTPCAWLDEEGALVAVGGIDADGCGRVLRGFGGQGYPEPRHLS